MCFDDNCSTFGESCGLHSYKNRGTVEPIRTTHESVCAGGPLLLVRTTEN